MPITLDHPYFVFHWNSNMAPGPECYIGNFDAEGIKQYLQKYAFESSYNDAIEIYRIASNGNLDRIAYCCLDDQEEGHPLQITYTINDDKLFELPPNRMAKRKYVLCFTPENSIDTYSI